jgi:hypothetical protein
MNVETFWNQQQSKSVTGTRGMCANLIAWHSISRWMWKSTRMLCFHFLDLLILNSFTLLTSCGSKLSHQHSIWHYVCFYSSSFMTVSTSYCMDLWNEIKNWTELVRNLKQEVWRMSQLQTTPQGRQTPSTSPLTWLDMWYRKHWPLEWRWIRCHMGSMKNKKKRKNSHIHITMWGWVLVPVSWSAIKMSFLKTV